MYIYIYIYIYIYTYIYTLVVTCWTMTINVIQMYGKSTSWTINRSGYNGIRGHDDSLPLLQGDIGEVVRLKENGKIYIQWPKCLCSFWPSSLKLLPATGSGPLGLCGWWHPHRKYWTSAGHQIFRWGLATLCELSQGSLGLLSWLLGCGTECFWLVPFIQQKLIRCNRMPIQLWKLTPIFKLFV